MHLSLYFYMFVYLCVSVFLCNCVYVCVFECVRLYIEVNQCGVPSFVQDLLFLKQVICTPIPDNKINVQRIRGQVDERCHKVISL